MRGLPATSTRSSASSIRTFMVSIRKRPSAARKKTTPQKDAAPTAPRLASRGDAAIHSVATTEAPANRSSMQLKPALVGSNRDPERGKGAENDDGHHPGRQRSPDHGRSDARIGERLMDRVERRLVDRAGAPPALCLGAHLCSPLPRDRVAPHRSCIRRWAANTSASAARPRSAARRKGMAFAP